VVLPDWVCMKGARVDCTAMAVSGKELRKGGMEVIRDEGGDNVLFAVRNDKEVTGTNGVEVVLPSGTREDTRLGTSGTGSMLFSISLHRFGFQHISFGLLV